MSTKEQLLQEIEKSSDDLLEEVLNFLLFTKQRKQTQSPFSSPSQETIEGKSKPIWESFSEFTENLPEEVTQYLPTDSASNLDYYLYANPDQDS
jgi:hypothetical protein